MAIPPADAVGSETAPALLPPPAPLDGFAAAEFKARRDALQTACGDGIVLIRGATEDEIPHGLAARYKQHASFFYLTGVDTPGAFLVLLPEGVSAASGLRGFAADVKQILFLPTRDAAAEVWTGPKLGPGEETEKLTGVAKTADAARLLAALTGWLRRNPVCHTLSPYGDTAPGTREFALMRRISDAAPVVQFRDAAPAVAKLRAVKSAAEVGRIRQAVAISAEGHRAALAALAKAGADGRTLHEYDVEADVFRAFRGRGAVPSFGSIVGGGVNGTTLHYEDNAAPLRRGDLVVVDIGARAGHYAGDLTRTYPVGGTFSPRQREVYALVLAAHEHAVAECRVGRDSLDAINDRCKEFLKQSPLRSTDVAGKEREMDHFMPHSLGHHLGLDVHDVGDREAPLEPGNVITIEPGLYLPAEGIGVRIEDDYLVTKSGLERLGPPVPRTIDEIEAAMRLDSGALNPFVA